MTADTLDTLTDTQLSELFTLEVAGPAEHKWMETLDGDMCDHCGYMRWQHEYRPQSCSIQYAWDANEVLPYLERASTEIHHVHREIVGLQWEVEAWSEGSSSFFPCEAAAPTLPRAICIALIRAQRASKS